MKNIFLFLVLALIPINAYSIITSDISTNESSQVYIYFVKKFYTTHDCSKINDTALLFEFNSGGNSKKKLSRFIEQYTEGMMRNEWKVAYFPSEEIYNGNTRRCDFKNFREMLIKPDFVYYLPKQNLRENSCYFSKLSEPFPESDIDVVVISQGDTNPRVVSYKDFADDSRKLNLEYSYSKTIQEYAENVSKKIDRSLYSLGLKTEKDCIVSNPFFKERKHKK
ncbi:MAG: hypothetical protein PF572_00050 [Patescibacteria group bacterium]|jgi:hypothetical protein|nr:hypothetical protein [Patescibacteria group bacterium]